jgi:hypothetical protein
MEGENCLILTDSSTGSKEQIYFRKMTTEIINKIYDRINTFKFGTKRFYGTLYYKNYKCIISSSKHIPKNIEIRSMIRLFDDDLTEIYGSTKPHCFFLVLVILIKEQKN